MKKIYKVKKILKTKSGRDIYPGEEIEMDSKDAIDLLKQGAIVEKTDKKTTKKEER